MDYRGVEYIPDEDGTAESVKCPLVDNWITPADCMENQDIAEQFIPDEYKIKKNWKEICQKCPFREY